MTQLDESSTLLSASRSSFPNTRSVGKSMRTDDGVRSCLQEITPRPVTPLVVKKFRNTTRPEAGAVRVFYGKAGDPDFASTLLHGIRTKVFINGGSVINPKPKTLYQHKLQQLQEVSYFSTRNAPLGRSHDQRPRLPLGLDPHATTFGVTSTQSVKAGDIINPSKTPEQIEKESQQGQQLYVRSHNAYSVGERINRNYNLSRIGKDCRFGLSTAHYRDGRRVAKSLQWLQTEGKLVSVKCDDFRKRTQPLIGKAHDPIAETLIVPENHTFGIHLPRDKFGAGELLYPVLPEEGLRRTNRRRALASAVRQHLKKAKFHDFNSLFQAFRHFDKNGEGFINKEDLRDVCQVFHLDLSTPVLESLMEICDQNNDGQINFLEFFDFLNWKENRTINENGKHFLTRERQFDSTRAHDPTAPVQRSEGEGQTLASEALAGPEPPRPSHVDSALKTPAARPKTTPSRSITSSSMMQAVVGCSASANLRMCGVPTVRTDLAVPRMKRFGDRTNYGEVSTVQNLLNPTIYCLRGVSEEHLFIPRTKDKIAQIFRNLGVDISEEMFEEAWKLASMRHPRGEVCVQIFRNVLKEIQA